MTKDELKQEIRDALEEAIRDTIEEEGHHDISLGDEIDEFDTLDSVVPIYTSDLLQLLDSDFGTFGYSDEKFDNVVELVQHNVTEFVFNYAYEVFDEVLEEVLTDPDYTCPYCEESVLGLEVEKCPECGGEGCEFCGDTGEVCPHCGQSLVD